MKFIIYIGTFACMCLPLLAFGADATKGATLPATNSTIKQRSGNGTGNVFQLDAVEVRDMQQQPGTTVLEGQTLQLLPSRTGTVTDALRGQSSVQYSINDRTGLRGGEITPSPNIHSWLKNL